VPETRAADVMVGLEPKQPKGDLEHEGTAAKDGAHEKKAGH
jgi:hypothetical protein